MANFFSRFRIFSLALIMTMAFSAYTVQAEGEKVDNGCDAKPFSLHDALGKAQNTSTPLIPVGLPGATSSKNIEAESAISGFAGLLQRIINGLTGVAAAIAVFFIVFNGGGMMLAAGDTEKIKKARTGVMWALIGLLLIMASYIIAKTVISLTYSGSSITENRNQLNPDCDPDTGQGTVTDESGSAKDETAEDICTDRPTLPKSCYAGGYGSSLEGGYSSEDECNNGVEADAGFQKVCEALGHAKTCSLEDIQGTVASDYDTSKASCQPAAGKTHVDGEYGQCTKDAINKHLDEKCPTSA